MGNLPFCIPPYFGTSCFIVHSPVIVVAKLVEHVPSMSSVIVNETLPPLIGYGPKVTATPYAPEVLPASFAVQVDAGLLPVTVTSKV